MCKASVLAEDFRNGEVGDQLGIYTGQHGLGTFHENGTVPGECATCLQTGARMIFEDIPPKLQEELGIQSMEAVTFIETAGSHIFVNHDLIRFDAHADLSPIPVAIFADMGVSVSVSFVPEDELAAEDVLDGPIDDVPVGDPAMEMLRRIVESRALTNA